MCQARKTGNFDSLRAILSSNRPSRKIRIRLYFGPIVTISCRHTARRSRPTRTAIDARRDQSTRKRNRATASGEGQRSSSARGRSQSGSSSARGRAQRGSGPERRDSCGPPVRMNTRDDRRMTEAHLNGWASVVHRGCDYLLALKSNCPSSVRMRFRSPMVAKSTVIWPFRAPSLIFTRVSRRSPRLSASSSSCP